MLVGAHQLWELQGRVEGREVILHEVRVVPMFCWQGARDWNWEMLDLIVVRCHNNLRPCLVRKNFQDSPSHRIFGRMHGALNIDENKN